VLDVVKGVGKKGLKVVVGVREVCGGATVSTDWLVVGIVEGATVSATVVLVISVVVGESVVVGTSVVVVASVVGTSVTGTLVVGAIVVLVVVEVVDVVVGTHVVVVSGIVVVVFTGLPLNDNSYWMFQTTPSRQTVGSQQQVPARKR
jgi:hypothetical protein